MIRYQSHSPCNEACHSLLLDNGIGRFGNVGSDIDQVTGKWVTIAAFPWRWVQGESGVARMGASVDPTGEYRA
jgi:kynurenine formamidase